MIRSPGRKVCSAGGDFPVSFASEHINVEEGYALHQTLSLYSYDHPERIAGSTLIMDVDNKTLHDQFKKGQSTKYSHA